MTGAEIIDRCRILARFSETSGAITRTFLCPAMHDVHRTLRTWMEEAGMTVTLDAAGNLHGFHTAIEPDAPRLLIGSHVDTVPDAGPYDGVLGVVLATALVRALSGRRLPFSIEVVAFSEEEGVRFGVPFIGSRALAGTLDDALLSRTDANGTTVAQAIHDFGVGRASGPVPPTLDNSPGLGGIRLRLVHPSEARTTTRDPLLAFLEFHIEQGPILDSLNLPLGIVTAITGQTRCTVSFTGEANHAGTTPMHLRRDALAAAARWTSYVERTARATPGAVATIGTLQVHPAAANVVPGEATATLDVRHPDDAVRHAVTSRLRCAAEKIAASRNVYVTWQQQLDQPAVACDPALTAHLARAVEASHNPVYRMTSGAGHDAMILAAIAPIAMLFLRSPGGISHHPAESVHAADVDAALAAGLLFLDELERSHV
jgi:allantoate deiminase